MKAAAEFSLTIPPLSCGRAANRDETVRLLSRSCHADLVFVTPRVGGVWLVFVFGVELIVEIDEVVVEPEADFRMLGHPRFVR